MFPTKITLSRSSRLEKHSFVHPVHVCLSELCKEAIKLHIHIPNYIRCTMNVRKLSGTARTIERRDTQNILRTSNASKCISNKLENFRTFHSCNVEIWDKCFLLLFLLPFLYVIWLGRCGCVFFWTEFSFTFLLWLSVPIYYVNAIQRNIAIVHGLQGMRIRS